MKQRILFICASILLFVITSVSAQETIELDFKNRTFTEIKKKVKKVNKGDFFKIKINDLNTYLYMIEVNSTDSIITTSLPKNLFGALDLTNLNTLASALPDVISTLTESPVDSSQKGVEYMKDVFFFDTPNLDANIVEHLLGYKNSLQEYRKEYNDIQNNVLEFLISAQTEQKDVLFTSPQINDLTGVQNDFKSLNNNLYSSHSLMNFLYMNFIRIYENLSNDEKKALKKFKEKVDTFYTELDKKYSELESFTSVEALKKIWESLVTIFNNKEFIYESLPIERTGDLTEVTIKITPRDSSTRLQAYTTKFKFPEKESHWSMSSGFYITGNPDENFSPRAITDSNNVTTYDLIEEDNGDLEIGISVMLRYHLKIKKTEATFWHAGIGTGVNIGPAVRPRALFGTGLAFGKRNKLIIDIGGIYMFYDKLSNAVERTGNIAIPEDYTVSASKMQLYFSLGYTISLD